MEEKNNLIIIKQLPIIEENLKKISEEIDLKIKNVNSLIVNEDTVKEVKKVRTDFNKDFKEFESQRKDIKNKILKPYNDFEDIYKKNISDKYKNADIELKTKIDNIENNLKKEKEDKVKEYFYEYSKELKIEIFDEKTFNEKLNLNITLSESEKSLKENAKNWIEKIFNELQIIETLENKDEVLIEYKKDFDLNYATLEVKNRHNQIEEMKTEKEKVSIQQKEEQTKIDEKKEWLDEIELFDVNITLSKIDEKDFEYIKAILFNCNIEKSKIKIEKGEK